MPCPNCKTIISKDALMCYACGQKLREAEAEEAPVEEEPAEEDEIQCPSCKTMVSRDAVMCYACGVNLKDALAAAEAWGARDDPSAPKKPQIFVKKIVKKKQA